jgi:hypothetical protein
MNSTLDTTNLGYRKIQDTIYDAKLFEALVEAGILPQHFQVIQCTADLTDVAVGTTVAFLNSKGEAILLTEGTQMMLFQGVFTETFTSNDSPYGDVLYGLKTTPAAVGESLTTVLYNTPANINIIADDPVGTLGTYSFNYAYNPITGMVVTPGWVRTSTNGGVTWTNTSKVGEYMYGAVWAPEISLFVLTGETVQGVYMLTSADGITWIEPVTTATPNLGFLGIAWSGALFVTIDSSGTGNTLTSTDGVNWTENVGVISALAWTSITWSSTLAKFVAVATDANVNNIALSTDGVAWTYGTNPNPAIALANVLWIDALDLLVAVGVSGLILTSTNGTAWTRRANGLTTDYLGGIAYGDGIILISSDAGGFLSSVDGINWSVLYTTSLSGYSSTSGIIYVPNTDTFLTEYAVPNDATAIISLSGLYETIGTNLGDTFAPNTQLSSALVSTSSQYLCAEVETINTGTLALSGKMQVCIVIV